MTSSEPTRQEWDELWQALADSEWTTNRAKAALQEAEGVLERMRAWRHPILWLRLRVGIYWLRRSVGLPNRRSV